MTDGVLTAVTRKEIYANSVFLDAMRKLRGCLDDPAVQEVMINGPNDVHVERAGQIDKLDITISKTDIDTAIKALAKANSRDEVTPVLDCRMPGFRVAAVLEPVGIHGPAICIRKHASIRRSLQDYEDAGGFGGISAADMEHTPDELPPTDAEIAGGGAALTSFFTWLVRARKNVMIVGGTGSGKTTFLNSLLAEVPHHERVLTIEDTAELQVHVPNRVSLEAMPDRAITIRALVRVALRFRPDRIYVGEVRGPESYDLLEAMNTGHSGGACSLHSNSALAGLAKMEGYVRMNPDASNLPNQALRKQIADTFEYVIFCSRKGKRRGPETVMRVEGVTDTGYRTTTIFDARELPL